MSHQKVIDRFNQKFPSVNGVAVETGPTESLPQEIPGDVAGKLLQVRTE